MLAEFYYQANFIQAVGVYLRVRERRSRSFLALLSCGGE